MRRATILITAGLLAWGSLPAHAQIYKCKGADGKVQYTQGGCGQGDEAKVVAPVIPQVSGHDGARGDYRGRAQAEGSAAERQVGHLVAEALARDDYRRAEGLAVNSDHWQMIADAKAKKRSATTVGPNRARVCTHSGYVWPGGGPVTGTTVCRRE
ncbi:DUF4124 domain-containing protein [Zoogloea sp.]|uniref:DUF4124 domain-containing protein n=1 Tax=Zoogloea sp. TaxID=49181 RepID=UPI0035B05A97